MKIAPKNSLPIQSGVALVLVLAILVLITGLVVAFFSYATNRHQIAASDSAAIQARILARGATDLIAADLVAEMRAGSTVEGTAPNTIFRATTPENALPARAVRSTLPAPGWNGSAWTNGETFNLVKQSAHGVPPYTNSTSRASSVNTASGRAPGGRVFVASRWLTPRLFPEGFSLADNQTPDWVYASRNLTLSPTDGSQIGKNKDPNDADHYVVGRYAYQIYNVGGLLDMNASGYNPNAGLPIDTLGRKGTLLLADLGTIPGLDTLTPAQIEEIVMWRNKGSWSDVAYVNRLIQWGSRQGWLRPQNNSATENDNILLGRQDLIALLSAQFGATAANAALPFLTSFTREVNAPSFRGYENPATPENPDLAQVRVLAPFTRRDGSRAAVGEPLMKTPFPLEKIDLLATGADAGGIRKFFGFARNSDGYRWDYQEFNSDQKIKTLAEVAAENREPNFFEVLSAGLNKQALGKTKASAADDMFAKPWRQVLRTGASIIDQWDSDSDPTVIAIDMLDPGSPLDDIRAFSSLTVDIAGVENLPYIQLLAQDHLKRFDLPAADFPRVLNWPWLSAFYKIQLWNPHRGAGTLPLGQNEYRIISEGETLASLLAEGAGGPDRGAAWTASATNSFINFSLPLPNAAEPKAEKPVQLMGDMVSGFSPFNAFPHGSAAPSFVGIFLGSVQMGEDDPGNLRANNPGGVELLDCSVDFPIPTSLKLQRKVGSRWVTYQTIPQIDAFRPSGKNTPGDQVDPEGPEVMALSGEPFIQNFSIWPDPRTLRPGIWTFGRGLGSQLNPKAKSAGLPQRPDGRMIEFTVVSGKWAGPSGGNLMAATPFLLGAYAFNDATGPGLEGHDGEVRKGDGVRALPMADGSPFGLGKARPAVLNRAFRSVAELSYGMMDDPWKSLDFSAENSGEEALLDLFTLTETALPARAGALDLNTAPKPVLASAVAGVFRDVEVPQQLSRAEATTIANAMLSALHPSTGPKLVLENPAALSKLVERIGTTLPGQLNYEKEAITRALADVANTRTWNLMVDLVAQSGRLAPTADGLEDFIVEGEQRIWVHLAIDRLTGKIVALEQESVTE